MALALGASQTYIPRRPNKLKTSQHESGYSTQPSGSFKRYSRVSSSNVALGLISKHRSDKSKSDIITEANTNYKHHMTHPLNLFVLKYECEMPVLTYLSTI